MKTTSGVVDEALVDFDLWPSASSAVAATAAAMDWLEAAYQASTAPGEDGLRGHAELGFALGYSPADAAA